MKREQSKQRKVWQKPEVIRSFTEKELEEEMKNSNLQIYGGSPLFSNTALAGIRG